MTWSSSPYITFVIGLWWSTISCLGVDVDADLCESSLTLSGDFGVLSGSTTLLEFLYEVEYDRFQYRIGEILEFLEPRLVASLLPVIFGDDCNGLNRDGSMTEYIGISASPADTPLETESCENPIRQEGNSCQHLTGRIMLYRKSTALASTITTMKDSLRNSMKNGDLDGVGGATRLSYLEPFLPELNTTLCTLSEDGAYGDVSDGDSRRSTLHFGYELELINQGPAVSSVLENVEPTLTARLLPKLFPTVCSDNVPSRRGLGKRRRLQSLLGIASSPKDLVESGLVCAPRFSSSNICRSIHGRLSLYANEDVNDNLEQMQQQIRTQIQSLLKTDERVRSSHSSIIDIRYFEYDLSTLPDEDSSDGIPGIDTDSADFPFWVIIVIALVVVLCCGAGVLLMFIRARDQKDDPKKSVKASNDGPTPLEEQGEPVEPLEQCPATPRPSKRGDYPTPGSPRTPRTPRTPHTPHSAPTRKQVYRPTDNSHMAPQSVPTHRMRYKPQDASHSQLPRPPLANKEGKPPRSPRKSSLEYSQRQAINSQSAHAGRPPSSPRRQPFRPHSDHVLYTTSPDGKRIYLSPRHGMRHGGGGGGTTTSINTPTSARPRAIPQPDDDLQSAQVPQQVSLPTAPCLDE